MKTRSPPSQGVWIEIEVEKGYTWADVESPPSQGVWIEIVYCALCTIDKLVTPFTGGVD